MLPPLTSIILVSYQTGAPLFKAIDSVLGQSMPLELIIVDNGNPEDVITHLRDVAADNERVKLLSGHGNIGFGRANNLGVAASRGEFVLLLNPDCLLREDTLAALYHHANALPSPFMIGARLVNEDGTDQRGCRRELLTPTTAFVEALHLYRLFPHLRLNWHDLPLLQRIGPMPAISGAFMFLSRRDYDLINGFDEGYFLHVEDLDFCFRFRKAGGEIYFAPDILVIHVGGTSDVTSDFIERCKAKGFTRYFHRNFSDAYPKPLLWCLDAAIWGRYFLRRLTSSSHT